MDSFDCYLLYQSYHLWNRSNHGATLHDNNNRTTSTKERIDQCRSYDTRYLDFLFVGTVLYVFYKHFPTELSLTITDGDAILPWYIFTQLPAGITGLLISGIFAAAMSTLSSSMNSAATAYVVDIHSKLPFLSMKSGLRTAQLATLFLE